MTLQPLEMHCIDHGAGGPPSALQPVRKPVPRCGPQDVLIAVAFAGVNRPDIAQRMGLYPPPPDASPVLGLEVSGTVCAVGEAVTAWKLGDAVCALTNGGGYAQYVAVPQGQVLPIPHGLSLAEAASLPENHFTVWSNVVERGALSSGEALLVHGGSSGIGLTAIQLARARGATVYATAGSAAKLAACRQWGAKDAINYREEDFVERIASLTGGRGVDVILDMVGGDYVQRNLQALASDGRLVQIAFMRGVCAQINCATLVSKRITFTGSTLRPQSSAQKARIAAQLQAEVWPLLSAGQIRPVIDQIFDLHEAAQAHEWMESSRHIGKIVLKVSGAHA